MIRLYSSDKYFSKEEMIVDNEAFFNNNISAKNLSEKSKDIMQNIDKAVLLDNKTGKIETPYGIASIKDLSTGCKTILNYIFITEHLETYPMVKAINATECGWNALEELFRYIECSSKEQDIDIIVEHDNDLYMCEDREYLVNGERKINSMFDFY